tara:strand:+ start:1143 stop:1397 length:255 start_codon:yes stop_codon:yes gene_type:complete
MFLNVEKLSVDQLIEKQMEIRQKISQAQNMGMMGPASQLQNMLDQLNIELTRKSQMQVVERERERKVEEGKDPEDDILNIGEIE